MYERVRISVTIELDARRSIAEKKAKELDFHGICVFIASGRIIILCHALFRSSLFLSQSTRPLPQGRARPRAPSGRFIESP